MGSFLYTKTEEQLQRARGLIRIAGWVALLSLLLIIIGVFSFRVFQLRIPGDPGGIGFSGLLISGGLALFGGSTIREDREARNHVGDDPIRNPLSYGMRYAGWLLLLFSVVTLVFHFTSSTSLN